MTDRTLDLTKALQEAQLQRLEASLSARSATPPVRTDKTIKTNRALRTVNCLYISQNFEEC